MYAYVEYLPLSEPRPALDLPRCSCSGAPMAEMNIYELCGDHLKDIPTLRSALRDFEDLSELETRAPTSAAQLTSTLESKMIEVEGLELRKAQANNNYGPLAHQIMYQL